MLTGMSVTRIFLLCNFTLKGFSLSYTVISISRIRRVSQCRSVTSVGKILLKEESGDLLPLMLMSKAR